MKRIRVMLVSPAHPPTDLRIVRNQAPSLAEQYEVICLLPDAHSVKQPGVRFIGLPFFRWLGWRLLLVHPLVLVHIIRLRPAVLHIYMPELLPIALLSRLFGVQVVYEVQENLRLKFDRKPRNNHPVFQRAFAGFERLARRYCYHLFTEDSYFATYPNLRLPPAVVHNYPNLSFFDALRPVDSPAEPVDDGPHLLYVGVVSFDRGLDTMIQVLSLLQATLPAIRLHLFGRCIATQAELEALPDYSVVRGNLLFYGHTAPETAYANSKRYVAGLALLKPVGDYSDSYPTKLFEYMALCLPVLSSDFPLYRRVVESAQCGYCVDPMDAGRIAQHLAQLIERPVDTLTMGQRGRQAVETLYNWRGEAVQLLNLYRQIVF